ncbi:MAG TPA: 5-formyltetrahydrofolate cyclo-ligase [Acidothermaceae bacterium]|jgi:5-formyltetrahydrofolate cyclo-ligase|nr:5-formyltetrahydrofolate cyclo-ligase [Acidothermaceae bacterium]
MSSDKARISAAKADLRRQLLAGRVGRPASQRTSVAAALAQVFSGAFGDRLSDQVTVASYLSIGGEPGTGVLMEVLAGARVIVPVLLPDRDLDWAGADAPSELLGVDAIASADLVLVPALAVDRSGRRLGRGGGSYDRALARVTPGQTVLAVVHDDEILDAVPFDDHDRPVDGALTPTAVLWFRGAGRD